MAPRRLPIPLYCDRATQTQIKPPVDDPWVDPFYMGSSRESTPHTPARHQAPSYSPSNKRSAAPTSPSKPQNSRQPISGLGQVNVVNTVGSQAANLDERPLKKRRIAFHEDESDDEASERARYDLHSVKESLDTMAAEAREDRQEIRSILQDLLHTIQQNRT